MKNITERLAPPHLLRTFEDNNPGYYVDVATSDVLYVRGLLLDFHPTVTSAH